MSIKIAHCADVHLISKDNKNKYLYEKILNSFRRLISICKKQKVEVLLISGDLFENSNIDKETLLTIQKYLESLDAYVFISPGNHDYLSLDSPYYDKNWPENVTIFNSELKYKELKDLKTVIYGVGFENSFVYKSLFNEFQSIDSSMISIFVSHGDLVNESGDSKYHPIKDNDILELGVDYLALGHIHKKTDINKIGKTYYSYPGNLTGRGFDEIGKKGFYVGTVDKGFVNLDFMEIESPTYNIVKINFSDIESEDEAYRLIIEQLNHKYPNYRDNFYRIYLLGTKTNDHYISLISLKYRLLEHINYVELIDEMLPMDNINDIREEISLKGIFVDILLEKIENEDDDEQKKIYEQALKYGLEAFEG